MKNEELRLSEREIAKTLRDELFTMSQSGSEKNSRNDLSQMETISSVDKTYVSPIFSMSEDEILNFVEEFNVNELATLSVAELNHIGEVLGIDPSILVE